MGIFLNGISIDFSRLLMQQQMLQKYIYLNYFTMDISISMSMWRQNHSSSAQTWHLLGRVLILYQNESQSATKHEQRNGKFSLRNDLIFRKWKRWKWWQKNKITSPFFMAKNEKCSTAVLCLQLWVWLERELPPKIWRLDANKISI